MSSYDNILVDKLTYQAQISAKLEMWTEAYKYIDELTKAKKEDLTNFQLTLYENCCIQMLKMKYKKLEEIKILEKQETRNKDSMLVYIIEDLKTSIKNEITEFCEKTIKSIDGVLLKKTDLRDYHKAYYNKMRGDFYLYQEIIKVEMKSKAKQSSSGLIQEKDTVSLIDAYYKTAYDAFFVGEKRLYERGCMFCLRVILAYCFFLKAFNRKSYDYNDLLKKFSDEYKLSDVFKNNVIGIEGKTKNNNKEEQETEVSGETFSLENYISVIEYAVESLIDSSDGNIIMISNRGE